MAFFPLNFSKIVALILSRVTITRTVNKDKNNSEDFGDSVKSLKFDGVSVKK